MKTMMMLLLFVSVGSWAQPSTPVAVNTQSADSEDEIRARLSTIKRIYIDSFGDDPISKQVQGMLAASLAESKRFIVTENKDKAHAILKGTGLEKTTQEVHAYSDSTAAGGGGGGFSRAGDSASGGFAGRAAAISDSSTNTETINDARVAVRLVDRDGDVIWATIQESKGGKYKGASFDVADKIVKELLRAVEKSEKKTVTQTAK